MPTWTAQDKTQIAYSVHTTQHSSADLLLIHGMLGSRSSHWQPLIPTLMQRYRVITCDLRGHGMSDNRATRLQPDQLCEDIVGLLQHLGSVSCHVAGFNIGGYLGLLLLLRHNLRVLTLQLHATKFYWTEKAVSQTQEQLQPDVIGEKAPNYANQLAQEHGGSRWRSLVRQTADLIANFGSEGITESEAARIRLPVLLTLGDRDEQVSLREAQHLSRVFPQGGLCVLPYTKHAFSSINPLLMLTLMTDFHQVQR